MKHVNGKFDDLDDNKTELKEFVTNAEKVLRCIELGEGCQEGVGGVS